MARVRARGEAGARKKTHKSMDSLHTQQQQQTNLYRRRGVVQQRKMVRQLFLKLTSTVVTSSALAAWWYRPVPDSKDGMGIARIGWMSHFNYHNVCCTDKMGSSLIYVPSCFRSIVLLLLFLSKLLPVSSLFLLVKYLHDILFLSSNELQSQPHGSFFMLEDHFVLLKMKIIINFLRL